MVCDDHRRFLALGSTRTGHWVLKLLQLTVQHLDVVQNNARSMGIRRGKQRGPWI